MVCPIAATIPQSVGNVLFGPGFKIFNVCIGEPRIFELADIETELVDHCFETSNSKVNMRVLEPNLVVTVLADEEFRNRQMSDSNPSMILYIAIQQRTKVIHPLLDQIWFHSCKLCDRLVAQ